MTKKKKKSWPKPSRALDGDSFELLEALERGESFESVPHWRKEAKKLQKSAENYFRKDARVSFRVSSVDLDNIKRMAAEEGLPYQTFLTSVIHKLTTGRLEAKP